MKTRHTDWLWALCISAALLLVCSKSSPLYLLNDWMDANIFFTTGKAMFSGRVLYRDVFDHKGPLLWTLATGRRGLFALWAALAAGLAVTSLSGGGYLVYYGLVLGVFAPLGLVPLVKAWRNTAPRAALRRAAPAAAAALALVWCLWQNPNTARLGRKAEELPQLRFAQQIGGGTLLNYGTLDGGFYTASGAMPPCRFFCITNMPLPGQQQQQDALLETAAVEYVAALDGALDSRFPAYERVDEAAYDSGEGPRTWYLYRRIDLFA